MKKNKTRDVLFSDNLGELFFTGAKITLITMIISIITMWLTAIFTDQIADSNMGLIIIVSTGIAISIGTFKIYEITSKKME
jgi:hypothetical protein